MRTKMKGGAPALSLNRLLNALELELIEASEEEILAAAKSLGMDPTMKGSAAFVGLKYFVTPKLSDFFEFEAVRDLQGRAARIDSAASHTPPKVGGEGADED
jgi:hypothetical protein